jgi:shikimate kinase
MILACVSGKGHYLLHYQNFGGSKRFFMRISLIGMSGTGKSHWSSQLVARAFRRFCCDDMIAKKLEQELGISNGTVHSMGAWMGFPFEPRYREREAQYLAYELEVLQEVLAYLETHFDSAENIIMDTTGSVIYAGEQILERLRRQTIVVYLDTPAAVQEKMRAAYLAKPAPVLWRDKFNKKPGETNEEALARCYPELLASRTCQYKRWAEVTLDYHLLRQEGFGVDDFLQTIGRSEAVRSR